MAPLLVAISAGLGAFWLYTAIAMRWEGLGLGPRVAPNHGRRIAIDSWLAQAGLVDIDAREFSAVVTMLFVLSTAAAYVVFGGLLAASATGAFGASLAVASYRIRRDSRRQRAQEAWPRLIEEIRLQTGSLGRSVPQALFDVGRRAPDELRHGFEAAHREWLLTTDLDRTLGTLKERLADATADMTCETLLIAHELGGADLDRRLEALADDRSQDVQGRKDARSRQAGARFARMFVLAVPGGMALAGMSIGAGRAAYRSTGGQVVVLLALGLVVACWVWAGRIMRLPEQQRVFQR